MGVSAPRCGAQEQHIESSPRLVVRGQTPPSHEGGEFVIARKTAKGVLKMEMEREIKREMEMEKEREMKKKINELWHNGKESDWKESLHFYWERLAGYSEETRLIEKKLNPTIEDPHTSKILQRMQQFNKQEWYDFLYDEYFFWKYTDKRRLVQCRKHLSRYINEDRLDELLQIRDKLLHTDRSDIQQSLSLAHNIHGLGTAGASGLLALMYPDDFGTVDQFVVKSFQRIEGLAEQDALMKINPDDINPKEGVLMIQIYRAKAAENNRRFNSTYWTPRTIDQILTTIDREKK